MPHLLFIYWLNAKGLSRNGGTFLCNMNSHPPDPVDFISLNMHPTSQQKEKGELQEGKQHGGGMVASPQKREGSMENLSLGNPKVKRTRVQLQFQKPQTHRSTLHCKATSLWRLQPRKVRNSPLGFPAAPKGMVKTQKFP